MIVNVPIGRHDHLVISHLNALPAYLSQCYRRTTVAKKKKMIDRLPPVKRRKPLELDLSDERRVVLQVYDDLSYLRTSDEDLLRVFHKALRYRAPNYFHSPLYKYGGWDGFVEFFSNKTGRFGTGLLSTIELALTRLARQYEIHDHRQHLPELAHEVVGEEDLKRLGFKSMDRAYYQIPGANYILHEQRGIIKAATGAGKSAILMTVLDRLQKHNVPTLVTTKGKLIKQLYDGAVKCGIDCGMVSGNRFEPRAITFCNVESVHKIGPLLEHFRALIVDEVHMFANDQGISLFERMPRCHMRIGLSATPWKKGSAGKVHNYKLKSWFGPELIDVSIDELMDKGILAQAQAHFHLIDGPMICSGDYSTDYARGVVENDKLASKVAEICKANKGRKLICVQSIEHGKHLRDRLVGVGENVHLIWGETADDTRDQFYELLRTAPYDITVIGSSILQTGIDVWIHLLINARGLKAEHSTEQLFGRGTRKAPDKNVLDYHDFWYVDDVSPYLHRHSRIRRKLIEELGVPVKFVGFDPN